MALELHTGIPNLGLDGLAIDLHRSRSELDADSRFRIHVELVACETRQHCGRS